MGDFFVYWGRVLWRGCVDTTRVVRAHPLWSVASMTGALAVLIAWAAFDIAPKPEWLGKAVAGFAAVGIVFGGVFIFQLLAAPVRMDRERGGEADKWKKAAATAEAEADTRARALAKRHTLAAFHEAGVRLRRMCTLVHPPPIVDVAVWVDCVKKFLRDHYDDTYVVRFTSNDGVRAVEELEDDPAERCAMRVDARLHKLEQIMADLARREA